MEKNIICNPLPVSSLKLQASWYEEGKALLKWYHNEEYNISYYEIYRSKDRAYASVAHVIPAAYNDHQPHSYELIDPNLEPGNYTYWVQSVDWNGKTELSNVVYLWMEGSTQFMAYPNPFKEQLELKVQVQEDTPAQLFLYDMNGKEVFQSHWDFPKGSSEHSLYLKNLSSGMYTLKVITPKDHWNIKLIKTD
jgi:hypothetical protein